MTGVPRCARRRHVPLGLVIGLAVLVAAACGSSQASPSTPPSVPPSAAPPSAAPSGAPAASEAPMPSPTRWPGGVVEAVIILGKADAEIQAAGGDLGAAAAYEDLEAMWGAADGLAKLIEKLQTQVPRIAEYPATATAAAAYEAAFPDMLAGAVKLRDGIKAGDAQAMEEGSVQLAVGLSAYRNARSEIGPLVEEALLMQRLLTK